MSKYILQLRCKQKNSVNSFLKFIKNNSEDCVPIYLRVFRQRKNKEKISVLKSPHINKKAQEHYNFTHFCINLAFSRTEIKKELLIFKKISTQLFPDLKLVIKETYSSTNRLSKEKIVHRQKLLKLKHNNNQHFLIKCLKKVTSCLKFLDYGGSINNLNV